MMGFGCCVYSLMVMSHAASATADGGKSTATKMAHVNSLCRWYGRKLTTNSSMSGLQKSSFTVTCAGSHHLLFTSTAVPPPFFLLLCLESPSVWKPGTAELESGICSCRHVSQWNTQHCIPDIPDVSSAAPPSLSISFTRDLTFPMTLEGRNDLYFLLLALRMEPALPTRNLFFNSSGFLGSCSRQWCKHGEHYQLVAEVNNTPCHPLAWWPGTTKVKSARK